MINGGQADGETAADPLQFEWGLPERGAVPIDYYWVGFVLKSVFYIPIMGSILAAGLVVALISWIMD